MNIYRTALKSIRTFYTFSTPGKTSKLADGSTVIVKETLTGLPPRLREFPRRAKLTDQQIKEIQQKRASDPDKYTVMQLAKEYNSFPGFIMSITQCPKKRRDRLRKQAEEHFENLPLSGKKAVIDRLRRKALW